MYRFGPLLLACVLIAAEPSEKERADLNEALSEAGASQVELVRSLEKHLEKYPQSPQRDDIERTIAKQAVELKDDRRTILYGEKALAKSPDNPILLERVAGLLLDKKNPDDATRAYGYAKRFEDILKKIQSAGPDPSRPGMVDELDRAMARAIVFQARALGIQGKTAEAVDLARKAYEKHPSAEPARELGRWLSESGRAAEALDYYAAAFVSQDDKNTEADRAADRARLGELYRKVHSTDKGLGDLILKAYDQAVIAGAARLSAIRERDPNFGITDPMEFTLTGLKGDKLKLSSLRGKVVLMDFWATWCGPCRAQHPLYDKVKEKFASNGDLVMLSINTDENLSAVEPFLEQNNWAKTVYFEDGLSSLLRVSSIPTTIIIDRKGRVYSRLNGFIPERFVDMLTERIRGALQEK